MTLRIMLTIDNISCYKSGNLLFKNVSLTIGRGSVVKVFGDNGSGKTTLLKILSGLHKTFAGKILYEKEYNIDEIAEDYRKKLQYISHENATKDDLTVLENLEFWSEMTNTKMLIPASLRYFNLDEVRDKQVKSLSQGFKKRVSLARLILCPSEIWLLDEPFANLDENTIITLKNLIMIRAKEFGIVIYTSPNNVDGQDRGEIPGLIKINLSDFCYSKRP